GLPAADGADAPAAEHLPAHQRLDDARGMPLAGDAAPQGVAGIGGGDAALLLLTIEGDRIGAELLAPEALVELALERVRVVAQSLGEVAVAQQSRQFARL